MEKGTTNPEMEETIKKLSRTKVRIWKAVARKLIRPRRKRLGVNLWKINKYSKEGDVVVVPDKVLAAGELDHKIVLAAAEISDAARKKIKGECMEIGKLLEKNPKGSGVKIIT